MSGSTRHGRSRTLRALAGGAVVWGLATGVAVAAPPITEIGLERSFEYAGLPRSNAIQAFDQLDGDEMMFTQRVDNDTHLSRCVVSGGTCTYQDTAVLKGYGHGESLEVYREGSTIRAWVGSGGKSKDLNWSRNISLIEYTPAASGATASYERLGTLSNLDGIGGTSGTGYRVAVATADDSDRIALRVQRNSSASSTQFAVYPTKQLTDMLLGADDKELPIIEAASIRKSHFDDPGRPHKSFQGFDIKGVGADKKFLYAFGGAEGQHPTIFKFLYTNGGNTTHKKTYEVHGSYTGLQEAEGVKVEPDARADNKETVRVGLKPPSGSGNPFRLYYFTE